MISCRKNKHNRNQNTECKWVHHQARYSNSGNDDVHHFARHAGELLRCLTACSMETHGIRAHEPAQRWLSWSFKLYLLHALTCGVTMHLFKILQKPWHDISHATGCYKSAMSAMGSGRQAGKVRISRGRWSSTC